VSFNLAPGAALGDAVNVIEKARREINMPPSIAATFQGTAAAFLRSISNEPLLILALAIPAARLAYDSFWGAFVADPFPPATRISGIWGLRLLVAGLLVTPIARLTGLPAIIASSAIRASNDFTVDESAKRESSTRPM